MKTKIFEMWKEFDLFGVVPSLSIAGQKKQKTICGFGSSIFMMTYIVFALIVSFDDLVLRQNPNIVISKKAGQKNGLKLDPKDLNVGFALLEPFTGTVAVDPAIVQPKWFNWKINPQSTPTNPLPPINVEIESERCTPAHFNGDKFPLIPAGFCAKMGHEPEFGTIETNMIYVQFQQCNNATSSVTCKPQSEIDQVFNTHNLIAMYPGLYVEPDNYKNPITREFTGEGLLSSATLSKSVRVVVTEFELETDSGVLLSNTRKSSHLIVDKLTSDVNQDGRNLLQAFIFANGRKEVQTRSYMKVQQALAGALSLIRIAFLLSAIFVIPCTKTRNFQDIIQQLYTIKPPSKSRLSNLTPEFDLKNQSLQKPRLSINSQPSEASQQFTDSPRQSLIHQDVKESKFKKIQDEFLMDQSNNTAEFEAKGDQNFETIMPVMKQKTNFDPRGQTFSNKNQEKSLEPEREKEIKVDVEEKGKEGNEKQEALGSNPNSNESSSGGKKPTSQKYQPTSTNEKIFPYFTLTSWFHNSFRCYKTQPKKYYKAGRNKISQQLCVYNLVRKFRDLDRIKALLLDQDQRVLFDNLPLPQAIGPDQIPNSLEIEMNPGNLSQNELDQQLQKYHEKILTKPDKTFADYQLLKWYQTGNYNE